MAEALVGGAFLSGFINVLFDRLYSPEVDNQLRGKKLDQLHKRLETTLYAAQAVVNDAEQKQINDSAVKRWLDNLQDAVYVADDMLDRVSTDAATQKKEVSNFFNRYLNLRDWKMITEIEDITSKLENIVKHKDTLGLKEIERESFSWRESTSLIDGSDICGRDQDKEAIIKLLLDDSSDDKISVIPIVGMGGVGKTTLAQWIYNDENLKKEFDLRAWVCVSEESENSNITRTIIQGIDGDTRSTCNVKELNLLQLDLKQKVDGKKFFVVLDDVWNIDKHGWDIIKKPFQYVKGSKILVTTRTKEVALAFQACQSYLLEELSDDHCWSVLAKHARFPEYNGNSSLEKIGREIVKKCNGLPLAAQTLGGLLQAKHDVKHWNAILTNDIWEISVNDSKIIPALRISYYHLPSYLKRCFVYCSLFPKDYPFDKDELTLLWMAEDLLRPPKRGETLEEVGYRCFDDLASRFFFKPSTNGNYFVMHDLMHDLAISVAGDFYFRSEELGKADEMSLRTRHLSYESFSHPISKNFDAVGRAKYLRTLLQINFSPPSSSIESAASITLSMFKYLRVLSFHSFSELDVLPDSVGELVHLRYLDLSRTSIKTLPESLSYLYNLQTLKLLHCDNLTMLPSGMQNLVNLRHFDISGTNLQEMPPGMSKLKNLQLLNYFLVGKHENNGIKELGELSNLRGSLCIRELENVTNSGEALEARIMNKAHIENLQLKWSRGGDMVASTSSKIEGDILDNLEPHKALQLLTISGYRGTKFPNWVGHSSYHNMICVSLEFCSNCWMLPSLGQLPSLTSLRIADFNKLVIIDVEFYKNDDDHSSSTTPFPSLKYLSFYRMSCWEVWHSSESNAFPQLEKLEIQQCPKLTGDLPNHLPSLKTLVVSECPSFTGNLPNHLPALETLEISSCDQLVSSLPRAPAIRELSIFKSDKVGLQEIPLSLQSLRIGGCKLVESIFQAMSISQPTCLQSLYISDCSSTISFMGGCIPVSVKTLEIQDCRKLEFPMQQQHELLRSLTIEESCDSLTSFPLDSFPNLKSLELRSFENLESLLVSQSPVAALQDLQIYNCPNFVSFPIEGLAAPTMTYFRVYNCHKLKSLPCHMNTLFPKLEYLRIQDCPEIDSFPDGGLPPDLKTLCINNCQKLLSNLSSMGVHEGLTLLSICGPYESVKSFPEEGLLPQLPSLTFLYLWRFSSLDTLDCKQLLHLTSLEELTISECPKLGNMTGERLPASLIKLKIDESPLMEERCKMKHPQIWPKISHIRGIRVRGRWVS